MSGRIWSCSEDWRWLDITKRNRELLKKTISRTLGQRKLVLVSNRGPVQFATDKNGHRSWQRGAGGLITALDSVLTTTKALWVAAAMTGEDRAAAKEKRLIGLPEDDPLYWLYLVDVDPEDYDLYYNYISNRILWFLQHYLFDTINEPVFDQFLKRAWTDGYVKVNRQFATAVVRLTEGITDPIIMVQDYHLYLVAGFIRQLRPDALLFHFVHIPWASPDYFRFLPAEMRRAILESLLANDLVGFHSWRYVRNFLLCCQEFLGHRVDLRKHKVFTGQRWVNVRAYPISIGVEELLALAGTEEVEKEARDIAEISQRHQLIVRIDRAELSKNLVRGFDAYALLLREHPELRGKIKFLAYAYPTRESLSQYQAYRRRIEEKVSMINSSFGDKDWKPVELFLEDNYHRSLAAMRYYDVLLTNPIYDGMNLVAKEGSVVNQRDGVIVLSENAGAYEELRDGVLGINPFDVEETMQKMFEALTMTPLERSWRANRLREIVERNDVLKWLRHQLRDIHKVAAARPEKALVAD